MNVYRPRGNDEELSGWETAHLLQCGSVAGHDPLFGLTREEEEALATEHRDRLARKRPVGFAPWPETTQEAS